MGFRDFNPYGTGRALDTVKKQGSHPYIYTSKRSYVGLILLIVFFLGLCFAVASLWEPNELPPEMNQKHRQRH